MNKRVRKYCPVLYSPHNSCLSFTPSSPPYRHWKDYLSQEVDDYYRQLMKNKNSISTANSPQKSAVTVCSPEHSFLGKSEVKSTNSKLNTTPLKDGNVEVSHYDSFSTLMKHGQSRLVTDRHSNYRA